MGDADPSLWFVAETGGDAIGVALCRPRHHGDGEEAWVATLGVVPEHRRRGSAARCLAHALSVLRDRGFRRARLAVDAENTAGAVSLYERVGMTVVEGYDTWERRP
jgi:ribosomal protein S18 acetylase RimI-like enzyme